MLLQEFMKAIMCFMVEFWDIERRPQPPIKPHSEPYIDFEWPLQGWCIDLPQVIPPFPRTGAHIMRLVRKAGYYRFNVMYPSWPYVSLIAITKKK